MTPEQQRAIAVAKARKRKLEANGGSAGPEQSGHIQGQQDAAEMFGKLISTTREGNSGRATAGLLSAANSSTLGALDPIMDGVDKLLPGAPGPSSGDVRAGLREEHPWSSMAGDLAGFVAPGGAVWSGGQAAAKALPQLPGKVAPYAARLAGLAGLGGAENAVFQSTVGASNKAAETGEPVGIPERIEMAKDGATDPLALAAGPAASLIGRGARGMFTGKVTPKHLRPQSNAPQIEAIEGMKNEAYQMADELGVSYTPDSYQNLIAGLERKLASEGIDPVLHQRATRTLQRMQDRVGDQPMTMQELDKVRQFVRRDVVSGGATATPAEQRLGMMMIDEIDDFIESGSGAMGANGQAGSDAIKRARSLNTVWRKSQSLQDAVENAQLRSASTGSGGNFENALRQEIRKIYQNPKKVAGFDEAERKMMRAVIEGDGLQNVLRNIGKLSPQGNGMMAALGIGSTAANPVLAPVWISAMGAKHLAQKGIKNKFDDLDELVRSGADNAPPMKNITPPKTPVPGGPTPAAAVAASKGAPSDAEIKAALQETILKPNDQAALKRYNDLVAASQGKPVSNGLPVSTIAAPVNNGFPNPISDKTDLGMTGLGAVAGGAVGMDDYNNDGVVDWKDWNTPEGRGAILSGGVAGLVGSKIGKGGPRLPPGTKSNGIGGGRQRGQTHNRNSQAGAIDIGGGPQRRKDLLKGALAQSQGAPVAGVPSPSTAGTPPPMRPPVPETGPPGGPLPWLAGIGGAGVAVMPANEFMKQPNAGVQAPPPRPVQPQSFGPSLKPDLAGAQQAIAERANEDARAQDQAQRQEYWNYLKSRGDGSSTEWNQIHQARAGDLKVTPEDAARGVIRKRLPYIYDAPISVLSEAPIEELIGGHWKQTQPALAIAQ